jgi:hypothetical protein
MPPELASHIQDSRMKYIVVMFFMLSSCAVLAQMQFGIMQMLLMEERCKKCNMCSLSKKFCGICDANSGGICAKASALSQIAFVQELHKKTT